MTKGLSRSRIPVTVAGLAICRQRPGTAKGHCFISLEDETGIGNLFVPKKTFHRLRQVITSELFLLAGGILQRSEGDQPTVLRPPRRAVVRDSPGARDALA